MILILCIRINNLNCIYLDNNATTSINNSVFKAMLPYFQKNFVNPSSSYNDAKIVRNKIQQARVYIAQLIDADPEEIIFTSGGTEANNTVIKGVPYTLKRRKSHIITSQIEHPSVLNPCKYLELNGYNVTYLSVDNNGFIDLDELNKSISKDTILISIIYANNEIGTIQYIDEISRIAKKNNITFHTDGVQACGKFFFSVKKIGVDFLSLSAHKINGPKGIGVLYRRKKSRYLPLIQGGHQEYHQRAGTENVPGIIGFGEAAKIAKKNINSYYQKMTALSKYLRSLLIENFHNIRFNGHWERRLKNTINISIPDIKSKNLIMKLNQKRIMISSGSACSSGNPEPSHVIKAISVPESVIHGTIRISLGRDTTKKEISIFVNEIKKIVSKKTLKKG